MKPRIVFLHSELAKYFLACIKSLSEKAEVTVFHWPVNPEAPFKFDRSDEFRLIEKNSNSAENLRHQIDEISPDLIVVSGWRDKEYLEIIKQQKDRSKVVLTLDNPWKGSLKQRFWSIIFKTLYKRFYSHCWVPGEKQKRYAEKLGFINKEILENLYSCDVHHFHTVYHAKKNSKSPRPNRFLYMGRYSREKGVFLLWKAFKELVDEGGFEWELWCLGTGPEFSNKMEYAQVKHFGFVQPENMDEILQQVDVFVLPSTYEPWGLVVHEMACAGMPLIMSDKVGAIEKFLVHDKNGCIFKADSEKELKSSLRKISNMTDGQLIEMSDFSYELSSQVTPKSWRETLLEIL